MTLAPPDPRTDPACPVARALLVDVRRLARLVDDVAVGTDALGERRALALGDRVERVGGVLRHLAAGRDDLLDPVDEVRRVARGVVGALLVRPAAVASAEDFARLRRLAGLLAALGDRLAAHPPVGDLGGVTDPALLAVLDVAPARPGPRGALARCAVRRRERLLFGS